MIDFLSVLLWQVYLFNEKSWQICWKYCKLKNV